MMKKEAPMFPHEADYVRGEYGKGYIFKEEFHPGASQRLWLAGLIMQGLVINGEYTQLRTIAARARYAIDHADGLLKELNNDTSDIS